MFLFVTEWHRVGAFFQPLGPDGEPVAIPVKDLDSVASPVSEYEQMPAKRVELHHRVHQRMQPIEAAPHIARRRRQVHAHAGRQMDHRGSRNTLNTSRSVTASMPGAIRSRSPEARTTSTAATAAGALRFVSTSANFIGSPTASRFRH